MKFLTIVLAALILFLTVKPGIDLISLRSDADQGCCSGQCKPLADNEIPGDKQSQKDDCNGNSCNPFQSCGKCVLSSQVTTFFVFSTPEISTNRNFNYSAAYTSQCSFDFWQPPRIA